jgi:hypothetical protein
MVSTAAVNRRAGWQVPHLDLAYNDEERRLAA